MIGFVIRARDTSTAVEAIVAAEQAGIQQIWMTQGAASADTLLTFGAAATRTSRVVMGTAIVPTYPRHPLALAQQALALTDLAPGRLRLGIGTSHRNVIEQIYGLPLTAPLDHLREYLGILRTLLWQGQIDHQGDFFKVTATLPGPAQPPLLISALRAGAFHLAGEISDGALSWVCPASYLLKTARPALHAGAAAANRPAPPLVAHIPVVLTQDRQTMLNVARPALQMYARQPFYAAMFTDAGFPLAEPGQLPDALLDNLIVSGTEARVAARLSELLTTGLDELMVMLIPAADEAAETTRLMQVIGTLS